MAALMALVSSMRCFECCFESSLRSLPARSITYSFPADKLRAAWALRRVLRKPRVPDNDPKGANNDTYKKGANTDKEGCQY